MLCKLFLKGFPQLHHVLAPKGEAKDNTVVTMFARLEFQDGKRKRCAANQRQSYHESGRTHFHLLVWLENVSSIDLPSVVSASLPENNEPLKQIVLSSQQSYTGSGWPARGDDSAWDRESRLLMLKHTKHDHDKGIRAFMPDVIGGMRSHMDVLASDGRGMFLRCVAGYVPKFSDSFAQQWLDDEASDYAVGRRVFTEYHPLAARDVHATCWHTVPANVLRVVTVTRFVVPTPNQEVMPVRVQQHMHLARRWHVIARLLEEDQQAYGQVHRALKRRSAAFVQRQQPDAEETTLEACMGKQQRRIEAKS